MGDKFLMRGMIEITLPRGFIGKIDEEAVGEAVIEAFVAVVKAVLHRLHLAGCFA